VILDDTGRNYTGTFTIGQCGPHGNKLGHVAGTVTGQRITVNQAESAGGR
jgi:hypothetical protein